jgi:hypothetical protein
LIVLLGAGLLLGSALILVGWYYYEFQPTPKGRGSDGRKERLIPRQEGERAVPSEQPAGGPQEKRAPAGDLANLRYGWKQGEQYVYSIRLEIEHEETREHFGGSAIYTVKSADAEGMTLNARGGLSRFHQPKPGVLPRAGVGLIGRPSFPLQAAAEQNEVRIDTLGRIQRRQSHANLPLGLGPFVLLVIDPLDSGGKNTWHHEDKQIVVEEAEPDPFAGMFGPGAFGRFPIGPSRLRPRSETPSRTEFEIRHRVMYRLRPEADGQRTIEKRIELTSVEQVDNQPRWQLTADGELAFDLKLGLPRAFSFTGEKTEIVAGRPQRLPVTFEYKLLEGEERERVLNPPPVKPVELKPPTEEEIAKAITALDSPNKFAKKDAAKLLARAQPNDQHAQVARLLEQNVDEGDHHTRQAVVEALGVWGDKDSVPLLIQRLAHDDVFTRKAVIQALGKLKDPRAAEPIASLLPDSLQQAEASQALQAIGPAAEKAVLGLLDREEVWLRVEVCKILKVIGTKDSVKALEEAAKAGNGLLTQAANEALNEIRKR